MSRKKSCRKRRIDDKDTPIPPAIISGKESASSNLINLTGFDFSKCSHQKVFWILFNTVVYDQSNKPTRRAL